MWCKCEDRVAVPSDLICSDASVVASLASFTPSWRPPPFPSSDGVGGLAPAREEGGNITKKMNRKADTRNNKKRQNILDPLVRCCFFVFSPPSALMYSQLPSPSTMLDGTPLFVALMSRPRGQSPPPVQSAFVVCRP